MESKQSSGNKGSKIVYDGIEAGKGCSEKEKGWGKRERRERERIKKGWREKKGHEMEEGGFSCLKEIEAQVIWLTLIHLHLFLFSLRYFLFPYFLLFSIFYSLHFSWRGGEQTMKRKKMRVLISCVEISFGKNQTSGDSLFLWIHLHHRRSNHDIRTVTKLSEERKKWRIDRIMWEGQRVKKVGRRKRKKEQVNASWENIINERGALNWSRWKF